MVLVRIKKPKIMLEFAINFLDKHLILWMISDLSMFRWGSRGWAAASSLEANECLERVVDPPLEPCCCYYCRELPVNVPIMKILVPSPLHKPAIPMSPYILDTFVIKEPSDLIKMSVNYLRSSYCSVWTLWCQQGGRWWHRRYRLGSLRRRSLCGG